jgi:hypothetical protein
MMMRRLQLTVIGIVAALAILTQAGYCDKTWVTKNVGRVSISIPSNWKENKNARQHMNWYVGSSDAEQASVLCFWSHRTNVCC